ncbi:hypothetical protein [Methylobacterium sp. WSM2598]|uniref:hypothetical protein n=1 Tax=Methylobacterium sp. WSM2598 TaxID=398261 RepID=UPI0003706D53|nr:hypothetical protein [Methylobacterium sp. WSM2598]
MRTAPLSASRLNSRTTDDGFLILPREDDDVGEAPGTSAILLGYVLSAISGSAVTAFILLAVL